MNPLTVSVVVPVYNEAETLPRLHERLSSTLPEIGQYEILFVDDGSTDGTLNFLKQCVGRDENSRFISLSRNFGHQSALKAGLDAAQDQCVITMDSDLQHPPDVIPKMIVKWRAGYVVVNLLRSEDGSAGFKKSTSSLFYRFISSVSDNDIDPGRSDFRLLDRGVVDVLKPWSTAAKAV